MDYDYIIVKVTPEVVKGVDVVTRDIVATIPGVESAVPARWDGFGHYVQSDREVTIDSLIEKTDHQVEPGNTQRSVPGMGGN